MVVLAGRRHDGARVRRLALALAVVVLVAGCGGDDDDAGGPPISVFGDSLTYAAAADLQQLAADAEVPIALRGVPGAALCDLRAEAEETLRSTEVAVLVLVFAGNRLSDCVADRDGPALVDLYATDARALAELARDLEVPVVLAGPPDMARSPFRENATMLNDAMQAIADDVDGVDYLDLRETLSPDGFTATLPCDDDEDESRGCADGAITVRDEDGVHFDEPGPDGYSSGAHRFAVALFDAAQDARS
jgi:hypothetical protein